MTGQNDHGRNQGLHDQGHPHRGEEFAVRVFRSALLEAAASKRTKKPDGGCSLKFSRLRMEARRHG
jgi:hypothetical protein